MLFNTVVFVLVIRVLLIHSCRKLKDVEMAKRIPGTFKTLVSIASIMSMFGLQWFFGALTIAQASLTFQWLFVIFSTLQGFFLFLFFCVLGQDAREEWLNVFSFGWRKKKKRGVTTSHAGTTRRARNTGSTYLTSKQVRSNTLRMGVESSVADSTVEMSSVGPSLAEKRKLLLAKPASISEEKETALVIGNGNTNVENGVAERNGNVEKVDLSKAYLTDLDAETPPAQVVEVPAHILERRFMRRYDPAPRSMSELLPEEETAEETEEEEDAVMSETSSVAYYGDLTQMTDLSILTNPEISDNDEISFL